MKLKITESNLRNILRKSIREAIEDGNNGENSEQKYPEEIYRLGQEFQKLAHQWSTICGKYRFKNNELYEILEEIYEEINDVCGDLSTYGISDHWDR